VLTGRGRDFRPVLISLVAWRNRYFAPERTSVVIVNDETGQPRQMRIELDERASHHLILQEERFMTPADLAAELCSPRKLIPNPPEPSAWLAHGCGKIAIHLHGEPKAVMRAILVHGWEADHRDLNQVAEALANRGVLCVAPDLPAHGASSGTSMTIPEGAQALRLVDQAYGPFELAVGHSVGAAILVYAMAKGMAANKIALLTPPGNYRQELTKAARAAGAPERLIESALTEFKRRCPDLDEIDKSLMIPSCPGLVAVAGRDGVLDPEEGRALASLWRNSQLLERDEATHRGILRDLAVIDAIAGSVHLCAGQEAVPAGAMAAQS
jgi:pimeloyl-ACP methyl ester carboxylesterase